MRHNNGKLIGDYDIHKAFCEAEAWYGTTGDAGVQSNKRMQQLQAQADEVVEITKENVRELLERDEKLTDLDQRTEALQLGASQFEANAGKLKKKYWWKNVKMMVLIGVVVVVIIIVVVVVIVLSVK